MACTKFKSIQVEFTEPEIKPANGYIVKWRIVGTTDYTTLTPNPKGSPVVIPNVPACVNVEGTVATSCDSGIGSTMSFVASTGSEIPPCSYYTLTEPIGSNALSIYRYIPCGATATITKSISGGKSITTGICAENSQGVTKVFGEGVVTQEGPCTADNPVTTPF